jgi:formylglycine-generating enzyme required for sulfatase activity
MNFASADTIQGIDIDFVNIGNAGNAADTQVMTTDGTTGYGSVGYNYRIGKYEVISAQWEAFTIAAGAPTGNPSEAYDQPANFGTVWPVSNVSWYEAAQFCNYLTSGNKGLGAYQLGTDGSITVDRAAAISAYGTAYVIPTEDEWYKAAYFKPNGSGYSLYANGTNIAPSTSDAWYSIYSEPRNVAYSTQEQNGTYDMMGNVWEWNETFIGGFSRGFRGGSYSSNTSTLRSSYRNGNAPFIEADTIGFRVASVPEPCSLVLLSLGGLALLGRRRK